MESIQRAQQLIEKFGAGECTPEEMEELKAWHQGDTPVKRLMRDMEEQRNAPLKVRLLMPLKAWYYRLFHR